MNMKKITYTTKLHVHRLELLLNKPNLCTICPAGYINKDVRSYNLTDYMHARYTKNPCEVCTNFLGYDKETVGICPCICFGADIIPHTLKAIKAYRKEASK